MKAPKIAFVLALAACALPGAAQDLSQKISFSGPAMSAKKLLSEISKKVGYPFETSPQTANEVLFLKVSDVPLGDLLKKIAETAGAEWAKEAACYRLVRSATLAQTQSRADIAARSAQIKAEIDKVAAVADKKSQGSQPAQTALYKLLRMIPAQDLAALPPGSRTVFSTYPTPMQRPLRGNVQQVLATFIAEHNARVSSQPEQSKPAPLPNADFALAPPTGPPITGALGKAMMIVQRMGADPTFLIEMKIFDAEGKSVGLGNAFINAGSLAPKTGAPGAESEIEFSQEAKEFSKIMLGSLGGQQGGMVMLFRDNNLSVKIGGPMLDSTTLSPEWKHKIVNPEQYEPLSLIGSDALHDLAKAKGISVVASLPDRALIPLASFVAAGKFRASALLAYLPSMGMKASEQGGWLALSPQYLSESYAGRLDRPVLGAFLRKAAVDGLARLDDLGQYMLRQPLIASGGHFEARYLTLICANAPPDMTETRLALRFYGMLSAGQRQTLFNGGHVGLGTLSPQQSAVLRGLVYDSMGGPAINSPSREGVTQQRIARGIVGGGEFFTSYGNDTLDQERTEALPNGVPGDGFVALQAQQNAAVLASRSSGGGSRVLTAGDLGGYLAGKASPEMAQLTAGQPDFDRFRQVRLTSLTFEFALSPLATMNRQLDDISFEVAAQTVPFEQLPAAFREDVERIRQVMAKRLAEMKFAPISIKLGNGGPPPPR